MKVRKAVILAAGFGTRVLPASKAIPKEMLNIVDKPAIQYIVEEMAGAGITNILIVDSRGKSAIADHFDRSPELEAALTAKSNTEMLETVQAISALADISFMRQHEMRGTGNAVLSTRRFVGDEPFVVAYADDVIIGDDPATAQIVRAFLETGKGAVAMKEVPTELVMKYSSLSVKSIHDNVYAIDDMIEKPKAEEIISNFSILGRCVLPPSIFDILENTKEGAGNEIQLTDAMKELAQREGMVGVDFVGTRYDMGNKLGILKAVVEVGLQHKEIGKDFRTYLRDLVKGL